jgi:GLPGLI family protein
MKRFILPCAAAILLALSAAAQRPDTARLLVHYKFTHVMDTTNRSHPYTENMVLVIGKSASAYKSYDGLVADQQFKKAYAASTPDQQSRINRHTEGSRTQYYQYPGEQKLFIKETLAFNEYLIQGRMPSIDWKIAADTATFGGLHCQKATCHFGGRDYTVWFCPDLPVHTGPWKLNGLPGVIVDAVDSKNEVVFQFNGVEKTVSSQLKGQSAAGDTNEKDLPPILRDLDDDPNLIVPPARAIKTTQKEYDKMKEAMRKDPAAFFQAQNNAPGSPDEHPTLIAAKPGSKGTAPVLNNPIELPGK